MGIKALLIMALLSLAYSQSSRENLFGEADKLYNALKEKNSFKLSQVNYNKAVDFYNEADNLFKQNGNLTAIRKKLRGAESYFKNAAAVVDHAEKKLPFLLKARLDAQKVDPNKRDTDRWEKGIELFEEAVLELEKGDLSDAEDVAGEAEQIFRQIELDAIRAKYFTRTKKLIDKAVDDYVMDYAPETLEKAKKLLEQADKELKENRYDIDLPRSLAQQANYEVRHATYIDKVLRLFEENDISKEQMLLKFEQPIIDVASTLDFVAEFDKSHANVSNLINLKIKALQNVNRDLESKTKEQSEQIKNLNARIKEMESAIGGMNKEKSKLQKMMERQADIRAKFKKITTMFDRNKAIVLRDGNNIIIRLISLNFKSGKSDIAAKYESLLQDVEKALKVFDRSEILFAGHTDSFGSDNLNQKLSEARANSVKEYITQSMNLSPEKIEVAGYGESKPIANNETKEGRKKNRRIDIVIKPIIEDY